MADEKKPEDAKPAEGERRFDLNEIELALFAEAFDRSSALDEQAIRMREQAAKLEQAAHAHRAQRTGVALRNVLERCGLGSPEGYVLRWDAHDARGSARAIVVRAKSEAELLADKATSEAKAPTPARPAPSRDEAREEARQEVQSKRDEARKRRDEERAAARSKAG